MKLQTNTPFAHTVLTKAVVGFMCATLCMPTYADVPKPIEKMASWLGFDKKATDQNQDNVSADVETDNSKTTNGMPVLTALDSTPNQLHGIEGLHQGRVPLGAISPHTLKTFVQVTDLIRREYVDEVNDEQLFGYAMSGMLTKLDKNAEFLDAKAYASLQSFTAGNVAGIGIHAQWQSQKNHWVITKVDTDSSAGQAGIKTGDYLHQIAETKLGEEQSESDVAQLLNGIAGTQVDVVVSAAGRNKKTLTLQRSEVLKSSIETVLYDNVAVIKLPVFQDNTRQQILDSLGRASKPIAGIILDVRNNPGGVLESAGSVASLFMRNQVVAQVSGRNGVERVINTEGAPLLIDMPVIVLQNRYSASAAEVLSSSLQTHGRALVVGEKSYGKGSVQSVVPIGSGQAVKMTTAHYLTADGKVIDGVGVMADVDFSENINQQETARLHLGLGGDDNWLKQALVLMNQAKLDVGVDFAPVGGF